MTEKTNIPDLEARKRALATDESFIVQAPAGSGKTELLMQRFLSLLSQSKKPEEILALTFTNKASDEMRRRIVTSLVEASENKKDKNTLDETFRLACLVYEKNLTENWNLLENPKRLKIQTLDSFSAFLTSSMPLSSNRDTSRTITENGTSLYKKASLEVIKKANDDSVIGEKVRQAFTHLGNSVNKLSERIVTFLSSRDQWKDLLLFLTENKDNDLKNYLEQSIKDHIDENLKECEKLINKNIKKEISSFFHFASNNIIDIFNKKNEKERLLKKISVIANLKEKETFPNSSHKDLDTWKALSALILTTTNSVRKSANVNVGFPAVKEEPYKSQKEKFNILLDSIAGDSDVQEALVKARELPEPFITDEDFNLIISLLHILPDSLKELDQIFKENSLTDFQAISLASLEALGTDTEPTDLLLSLDYKINHILIDEFQDTSLLQLEILKKLTNGFTPGDGRTIFLVGDPMQSIYLFRKAEVGLFLNVRDYGLNDIKLTPLTLNANFRSTNTIVDFTNDTFSIAFPSHNDHVLGSIKHEKSFSVKGDYVNTAVEIKVLNNENKNHQSFLAVEKIKALLENDKNETIAVLARGRSHIREIARLLKEENIEFVGKDLEPLSQKPHIFDLLTITKALSNEYDKACWLGLLRMPTIGISLNDINNLCLEREKESILSIINNDEYLKDISKEGQLRILKTRDILISHFVNFIRTNERDVIYSLWISIYAPSLLNEQDKNDCENFFDLLDKVKINNKIDTKELKMRLKDLYTKEKENKNAVQIMTIHGSKGLEFDHVIIPFLEKKPRGEDTKLLLWLEKEKGLLLSPIESERSESGHGLYEYLKNFHYKKRELEKTRLLYVAMTRAKKGLYLFCSITEGKDPQKTSLLHPIKHLLVNREIENVTLTESHAPNEYKYKRLATDYSPQAINEKINVTNKQREEDKEEEIEFNWTRLGRRYLGTVMHELIMKMTEKKDFLINDSTIKQIKIRLMELGLNRDEAEKFAKEGVSTLSISLNDEKLKWIVGSFDIEDCELPLTIYKNNEFKKYIIDRTFVDIDNIRWIIDYKFSSHEGSDIDQFFKEEKERYKGQLFSYEETLKALGEQRLIKKALYYPAFCKFIEIE